MIHILLKEHQRFLEVYLDFQQAYIKKSLASCFRILTDLNLKGKSECSIGQEDEVKELSNKNLDDMNIDSIIRLKKKSKGSLSHFFDGKKLILLFLVFIETYTSYGFFFYSSNAINNGIEMSISFRSIGASGSVIFFYQSLVQMMLFDQDSFLHKRPVKTLMEFFEPYTHQLQEEFFYVIP